MLIINELTGTLERKQTNKPSIIKSNLFTLDCMYENLKHSK